MKVLGWEINWAVLRWEPSSVWLHPESLVQCACFRAGDWKLGKCPLFPTLYLRKRAGTRIALCSVGSAASHKQLEGLRKRCCHIFIGPSSPVSNSDHHKCLAAARHCEIPRRIWEHSPEFPTYLLSKQKITHCQPKNCIIPKRKLLIYHWCTTQIFRRVFVCFLV